MNNRSSTASTAERKGSFWANVKEERKSKLEGSGSLQAVSDRKSQPTIEKDKN